MFWMSLVLTIPTLVFSTGLQDILGLERPALPGQPVHPGGLRHSRSSSTAAASSCSGAVARAAREAARHDDADLARDRRRVRLLARRHARPARHGLLVGARHPHHDHAARPLDRDVGRAWARRTRSASWRSCCPTRRRCVHGDHVMTVPVAELTVGDLVLVRPGAAIPVDGEVVDGDVRRRRVAADRRVGAGAPRRSATAVVAGSINGAGALTVRVTKVGGDTALAGIMKLVADAQASKSGAQLLADRAAALALLRRARRGGHHARRLAAPAARRPGLRARARRHRARHRLPARPRPRDPAGRADLDRDRRAARHPGAQPRRPRGGPRRRRRAVRQDRHAHRGPAGRGARSSSAGGHRRTRCSRSPRPSRRAPSIRSRAPSSPRPRERELDGAGGVAGSQSLAGRGARPTVDGRGVTVASARLRHRARHHARPPSSCTRPATPRGDGRRRSSTCSTAATRARR